MLGRCLMSSISCSSRRLLSTSLEPGGISSAEAEQAIWNRHVLIRNRRGQAERRQREMRRLLIGRSDAGRFLTLVIEETIEPTTWLIVTGWESTSAERMILERS